MMAPGLHPLIEELVDAYLDEVDAAAPGLVDGLYLTGSAALGDFRPRTSDVDFVAVTTERPDAAALAGLTRAHARLRARRSRPHLDGLYVTWGELASDPALRRGPHAHAGRFHPEGSGPGDPVTWHTVARHGVACRGPAPADIAVWTNPDVLAAWTLDNLDRYWGRLLDRAARPWDRWGLAALTPYGVTWIVLGVSRLHYTLATGGICSKEAAGMYALRTFQDARWQRVVAEALRIRQADQDPPGFLAAFASAFAEAGEYLGGTEGAGGGALYQMPGARRRDALAFGRAVIADARNRLG